MRCYICNSEIPAGEISLDRRYKDQRFGPIKPCTPCQIEVDAVFEDPLSEDEIDRLLAEEIPDDDDEE